MAKAVRIRSVEYGTVGRIIRTVAPGPGNNALGLSFKIRDETYGGISYVSLDLIAEGSWVVVQEGEFQ